MPDFSYEALGADGAVTRGAMAAEDELALEAQLRISGQYLIRAEVVDLDRVAQAPPPAEAPRPRVNSDGPVARKDLLAFTEYLWGSAQAGLPILTTLGDLEIQTDSKRLRKITAEVREAMVEEGKSLSEALADYPRAFPGLYVGTVEAGELTGQLDYTLKQLVDYLEWQQEITLQIRQATLYPSLVLLVMGALVVVLITYVYPKLLPIFTGFNVDLPLPTRIVLGSGAFLHDHWKALLAGIVAVVVLFRLVVRTPRGRLAVDTVKLRMPIFGPLVHQLEMARVVTYMALFYRTGIDLMRGFSLLEQMIVNRRVSRAVGEARALIAGGESIAQSLARTGLFPSVVIRSFALGESTGKLDESLDRARAYYNREVPAAVKRMLSALQPLLVVVLGVLLAVIALSIFLPIVRIYQTVGQ